MYCHVVVSLLVLWHPAFGAANLHLPNSVLLYLSPQFYFPPNLILPCHRPNSIYINKCE